MIKKIDNKSWHVGIKGLVFDEGGKLLLLQEANGMWELPGGRMEHGKTFEQTLKREIMEEMGVGCEVLDTYPYWAWPHQITSDRSWRIFLCFRIKLHSLDFIRSDECVDHAFFDPEGLKQLGDKLYTRAIIDFYRAI